MNIAKIRIYFFILWLVPTCILAQNTQIHTAPDLTFRTGYDLYQKEKYTAAQKQFEKYFLTEPNGLLSVEAEFYAAACALYLFQPDAENRFLAFVKKYPTHPKSHEAFLLIGNFYKSKKDYKKAISYYSTVDFKSVSKDMANEGEFNFAYSYFNEKQYDKALPLLEKLKSTENKYTYASSYYAGYIKYRTGMYDQAVLDLKKAENNESYKPLVPFLLVNIYYRQKKYDELLAYTNTLFASKTEIKNQEDIYSILCDVYFRKENFKKSVEFAQKYLSTGKELPDGLQYKYAKALYYTGANDQAIEQFKQLNAREDTLGQYSSYFLGLTYLRAENKSFALPAFEQASKFSFSPDVKEESIFLSAKLSYEAGHFTNAINYLKQYRKAFPRGKNNSEVNELLSDALLNTNNYSEALTYIESLPTRSTRIDAVYQKVTFYKAAELYNQDKYADAKSLFEKSKKYKYDKETYAAACYWLGEIYSIEKQYDAAIAEYTEMQENTKDFDLEAAAQYALGYCYYNLKQYEKALYRFKAYTEAKEHNLNKQWYTDAVIRLGDCYYTLKKYNNAQQQYDKAALLHNPEIDYLYFQKGLIAGITGKYDEASSNLDKVIYSYAQSPYYEPALFNKANFSLEQGNYREAAEGFTLVIKNRPGSTYAAYSLEKRAICNINLKNPDLAYADYQQILQNYPTSPSATAALQGIQEIYAKEGKNEDFEVVLQEFKSKNPQKNDIESIEFASAKALYFDQKYNESVKALSAYVANYPQGAFIYDVQYYLADSYFRLGQLEAAIPYYQTVINLNKGTYTSKAYNKLADIYLSTGKYSESISAYKQLAQYATSKKEQTNVQAGLMTAYYKSNAFDSSAFYAEKIITSGTAPISILNKAYLSRAKATYSKGDIEKTLDYLVSTENEAKDENGAEASYLIGEIYFKQTKYKASLNELFSLNTQYSGYTTWVGRSFLLIADNYIALEENFQAKATLESLIKNFPDKDIVRLAQEKLQILSTSKENSR